MYISNRLENIYSYSKAHFPFDRSINRFSTRIHNSRNIKSSTTNVYSFRKFVIDISRNCPIENNFNVQHVVNVSDTQVMYFTKGKLYSYFRLIGFQPHLTNTNTELDLLNKAKKRHYFKSWYMDDK